MDGGPFFRDLAAIGDRARANNSAVGTPARPFYRTAAWFSEYPLLGGEDPDTSEAPFFFSHPPLAMMLMLSMFPSAFSPAAGVMRVQGARPAMQPAPRMVIDDFSTVSMSTIDAVQQNPDYRRRAPRSK